MRGTVAGVTACVVAVVALTAGASEKPPGAYQQAMKDLGATNRALGAHIKAVEADGAYPDYMPIEKDAATLKAAFAVALAFWQEKKVDDAVDLAKAGATAVADLQAAMKDKNYDGVVMAAAAIGKTCGTCHMAHREKLPDDTFEIK
jgi:cytochrome c556